MISWFDRAPGRFVFSLMMAARALISPVAFGAHAMVFNRDGKVLLARHTYGGWGLVGGGINRGEPPLDGLLRELREELGAVRSDPPIFVGLYTRRSGWATNVIVLYRLMNAEVDFHPNAEIAEIAFVDPANPGHVIGSGTGRRLSEHLGQSPPSPYW